jgi:RNA polymerase sigma factor (TIGR02999 family)
MADITHILEAIDQGDPRAAAQLLPLVYDELRQLAAQKLTHEKPGQTLQATALVHEAYLRLVDSERRGSSTPWNSRGHFFAAAAEAMRRILIDNARRRRRGRHGGQHQRIDLDEALTVAPPGPSDELLALDEALGRLAAIDPPAAKLVELRYFAGLTMPQAAEALGLSLRTAERNWTFARTWLHRELASGVPADAEPDALP